MTSCTLHDHDPEERPRHAVWLSVEPEAVACARREVGAAARAAGIGRDRVGDLVVALAEAVTNALEAQLEAGVTAPVEVTCTADGPMFVVRVRDHGRGFRPEELPQRPPHDDERHLDVERGWGMQLMRELVDELAFESTGRGTVVCLGVRQR